jgi:GH18 family chitinase
LLANYKLQDSGPEDIKIINNAKTIQEWHSSGDAQSIENDTKEFLAAGTYTVTANTYVLGTGASALTCTPDNATQTKTLGNNDNWQPQINYSCANNPKPTKPDTITVSASGLDGSAATTIEATFTPLTGGQATNAQINIQNGSGSSTVQLNDATQYSVSASSVTGYNASYQPATLIAKSGGTEKIVFAKAAPPASGTYTTTFDGTHLYTPQPIALNNSADASLLIKWTSYDNTGKCYPITLQSSSWADIAVSVSKSDCNGVVCQCAGSAAIKKGESIQVVLPTKLAKGDPIKVSWPEISGMTSNTACTGNFCNVAPGKLLGGYFTDWATYHYTQDFPAQRLYGSHLNTVFYQAALINNPTSSNPTVGVFDSGDDPYLMAGLAQWRYDHPNSHVMLSFGGWGDTTAGTHPSADIENVLKQGKSATTKILADNMVNAAFVNGFNGVDIDYEWWGAINTAGQLDQNTANQFVQLFDDIKSDEANINSKFGLQMYISIAAPGGADKVAELSKLHAGAWRQIASDVDFFDPMTYDFYVAGQKSPTGHQSGFGGSASSNTIQNIYAAYVANYVPTNKIALGVPTYGRAVFGANAAGQSHIQDVDAYTGLGGGVYSYKCIMQHMNPQLGITNGCASIEDNFATLANEATYNLYNTTSAEAPWISSTSLLVGTQPGLYMSFDDQQSVAYKVANSAAQNGAYTWELDEDISPQDSAAFKSNSITEAMYHAVTGNK